MHINVKGDNEIVQTMLHWFTRILNLDSISLLRNSYRPKYQFNPNISITCRIYRVF